MSEDKNYIQELIIKDQIDAETGEQVQRRQVYLDRLAQHLKDPEFRAIEGFPIGTDEAILALSDPPYYTACPNPFLEEILAEWVEERKQIRQDLGLLDDETPARGGKATIVNPSHRMSLRAKTTQSTTPIPTIPRCHTKPLCVISCTIPTPAISSLMASAARA